MRNGNAEHIAALIEPGRVHRDVYTDPDLFELEMARIFGRAWLFVGHESRVPIRAISSPPISAASR